MILIEQNCRSGTTVSLYQLALTTKAFCHLRKINIYLNSMLLCIAIRDEKCNSHRIGGMATQCVEWLSPDIERINREALSLYFLQEKIKRCKLAWSLATAAVLYLFELNSVHTVQFCCQ